MRKQQSQQTARTQRPETLTQDISRYRSGRKTSRRPEAYRNRRIEVSPRRLAKRVDHSHDDEAEGERDSDMRHSAAANVISNNGSGTGKNQRERAK